MRRPGRLRNPIQEWGVRLHPQAKGREPCVHDRRDLRAAALHRRQRLVFVTCTTCAVKAQAHLRQFHPRSGPPLDSETVPRISFFASTISAAEPCSASVCALATCVPIRVPLERQRLLAAKMQNGTTVPANAAPNKAKIRRFHASPPHMTRRITRFDAGSYTLADKMMPRHSKFLKQLLHQ